MYKHLKSSFSKHLDFILLDILCMEGSLLFAYFIRFDNAKSIVYDDLYTAIMLFLIFVNIFVCYILNIYSGVLRRKKAEELFITFKQVAFTGLLLTLYMYFTHIAYAISRISIIWFLILYFIITFIARIFYKCILRKFFFQFATKKLVLITDTKSYKTFEDNFNKNNNEYSLYKTYYVDKDSKDEILNDIKCEYVDEIYISLDTSISENMDLINDLSKTGIVLHIEISFIKDFNNYNNKLFIDEVIGRDVITCTMNTIDNFQLFIKRLMDIFISIIGIFITFILFIIVGPIIYFKSKGPIFFTQKRVGKNGKIFNIIKFRSMVVGADELKKNLQSNNKLKNDKMFKMDDDPRIIKGIGHFIRKTSIDEFPQFINVLMGDMSVVGTRPPTLDEWEHYDLHHRSRLSMKPGITGLWQVSGRSQIKDFEDVVRLDNEYIKNFSIFNDVIIIFKTIIVVICGKGAV